MPVSFLVFIKISIEVRLAYNNPLYKPVASYFYNIAGQSLYNYSLRIINSQCSRLACISRFQAMQSVEEFSLEGMGIAMVSVPCKVQIS
jgi:hypothetical protein